METYNRFLDATSYNPDTGIFTATKPRRGMAVGTKLGTRTSRYVQISVTSDSGVRKLVGGHVLAWFFMTGHWPTHEIDHIDRNGFNNAWDNLRIASRRQNQLNTVRKNPSKLGRGVVRRGKRFGAKSSVNRVSVWLGTYNTPEEAAEAYVRFHTGQGDAAYLVMS